MYTSTFDFDNVPMEYLNLNPHEAGAQPAGRMEFDVSSVSNSTTTDQSAPNFSACKKANSKFVDSTHATLSRGAFHQWISTLFFLIVAILCLCLNNQPISSYGENIKAITLLSPTLFPIVCAAVLGKVLRRIGLFKVERSSTIGTLEQLIGSQSFFASIERQFGLRRIDFLGVAIIAAWLLSPLGDQASLRLSSTKPSVATFTTPIKYH
ncbi:hypothetical protein M3J09_008309 [Ascochyta lentis]